MAGDDHGLVRNDGSLRLDPGLFRKVLDTGSRVISPDLFREMVLERAAQLRKLQLPGAPVDGPNRFGAFPDHGVRPVRGGGVKVKAGFVGGMSYNKGASAPALSMSGVMEPPEKDGKDPSGKGDLGMMISGTIWTDGAADMNVHPGFKDAFAGAFGSGRGMDWFLELVLRVFFY